MPHPLDVPPSHPFSPANLPYGVFRGTDGRSAPAVAIGDGLLDLGVLAARSAFDGAVPGADALFGGPTLRPFMAAGAPAWAGVRRRLSELVSPACPDLRGDPELLARAWRSRGEVTMLLPTEIGDYTDFYASRQHATNVGIMFRGPENALMPNWLHLPVGYHGRASSIVVDGTPIRRPHGQLQTGDAPPTFGPSRQLDFELEVGFFMGPGNALGEPIPVERAHEHIFGFVLVNDWSARDIQRWEYVPLGPFLGKNFATSISPWVVPLEALLPYRVAGPAQEPAPLPYLADPEPWSFDVALEVSVAPSGAGPKVVCRSNLRHLYWNVRQMVAHHTSGGCNLRPGDLLASGTISGPDPDSFGSLLELAWRGTRPVDVGSGAERTFLADGDRVTMSGRAGSGDAVVGFGEVSGVILPA